MIDCAVEDMTFVYLESLDGQGQHIGNIRCAVCVQSIPAALFQRLTNSCLGAIEMCPTSECLGYFRFVRDGQDRLGLLLGELP